MDLELIEIGNGGELIKKAKDLSVISGLENMVYLALFGGNVEASTPTTRLENEQAFDWWGNSLLFPNDPGIQFNSETERKLLQVALNSSGRIEIQQAIKRDLEFMKMFAVVTVEVSIIATDKLLIAVKIQQPDNLAEKDFIYIWDSTRKELSDRENISSGASSPLVPSEGFDYTFDFEFE